MSRMHVVILCGFDTYMQRALLLKDYYERRGHEVTIVTSDFSHWKKEYLDDEDAPGLIHLPTASYSRNLSLRRLRSHYRLAKDMGRQLEELQPDWIHVLVPMNTLCKVSEKYKKRHPQTGVVLDVIDLWPDSLPIKNLKDKPPLSWWRNLRAHHMKHADLLLTECRLFADRLSQETGLPFEVVYWAHKPQPISSAVFLLEDQISLAYLGSINNIIDDQRMLELLKACQAHKPVVLRLVGRGERKNELIAACREAGIQVIDYGEIYDFRRKLEIFSLCSFGLNVIKPDVVVGLSMKSIDYLEAGLPLISTLQGDTRDLIEKENAGLNLNADNLQAVARQIAEQSPQANHRQRVCAREAFLRHFTRARMESRLDDLLPAAITGRGDSG